MAVKLEKLGTKVVRLRDKQNKDWAEIGEELEVGVGKAMLAYEFATVEESEKFKAKTDDALAKMIVKARDGGMSWGKIMARCDKSEGYCRKAYETVSGETTLGNRVGKGGRYPGGGSGDAKPKKKVGKPQPAAKKSTKKVADKKSAPAKKVGAAKKVAIGEMNEEQITTRLTGKTIDVENSDGETTTYIVRKVQSLDEPGGELVFVDKKSGKAITIDVDDIAKAGK